MRLLPHGPEGPPAQVVQRLRRPKIIPFASGMSVPVAILGEKVLPRSRPGGDDARSAHMGEGQGDTYADRIARSTVARDTVAEGTIGDSGPGRAGSPRAQRRRRSRG